ncbi:MAG TPA: hypothetical protein VHZ03_08320 [Trebonia sp.]|jgi:hypothetical protein|nr:hypothetical protein [Trebonia sp.]
MKFVSDVGPDAGYGAITAPHMAASAAALAELAQLTSVGLGQPGSRVLHVRLSHFEHGAALSLQLFGFWVLPATSEPVIAPAAPGLPPRPPAAGLLPPDKATADQPLIYAVTANHPVPVQVEHALATLAILVGRQQFTSSATLDVSQIDVQADEVDTQTTAAVRDTLRSQGWRAAARAISARSAAAGLPLAVTYVPVLMEPGSLALRAPILRRVYNEMPEVRHAIDKAATVLSQGLTTVGGGSEQVASFARDMLDVGSTRTYLAHLARDAFVCGNGYLSFGAVADEDVRLLQPEQATILGPRTVLTADGNTQALHRNVMHMTGGEQQDSPYGLSILEPFVGLQLDRELFQETIDIADAWTRGQAPMEARERAQQNVPLAHRRLEFVAKRITETLGGTAHLRAEPPPDLYFPGHELMSPAAVRLSLADNEPASGAADRNQS